MPHLLQNLLVRAKLAFNLPVTKNNWFQTSTFRVQIAPLRWKSDEVCRALRSGPSLRQLPMVQATREAATRRKPPRHGQAPTYQGLG
eukprot:s2136_g5.t1